MDPAAHNLIQMDRRTSASGDYVVLTLNRPEQMNPLDFATVKRLEQLLLEALVDDGLRGVILTGAPPAFSAGGDLKGYVTLYQDKAGFTEFLACVGRINDLLSTSRLVSIAAVNGVCVAGGLEIVLACDLVVMSEDAVLIDGHVKYWQLPGGGGTQRLPRAIGPGPARAVLLTGDALTAHEAHRLGLVYRVCQATELVADAAGIMERIIKAPSLTIETVKKLVSLAENTPLDAGLAHERAVVTDYVCDNTVASSGLQKFLERRDAAVEH